MGFAPRATIDQAALRHNLRRVRQAAPGQPLWAVIKANGYGHGMATVARALEAADGFAVARIEEALRLRGLGVEKPLLVLEGVSDAADLEQARQAGCELVLHQPGQLELLESSGSGSPVRVWLKVDTGMHRLGFRPAEVADLAERLAACPAVSELNLMTHLANADDPADPMTAEQCARFAQLNTTPFSRRSIANSAGLLGHPESRRGWLRPGIMLYGVSPFAESTAAAEGLRPVMHFSARVIAVNRCAAGERVGYGGRYTCPESMPVAVVGVGYGDGYPRHAGDGTPLLIRGQRLPLAGRVSMDMLCVDARRLPDLRVGEEVTLWGDGLPVEEIARAAGTIAYELLCGITGRVEFVPVDREEAAHGPGG